MAKIFLNFEITNNNNTKMNDPYEVEQIILGILNKEIDIIDYDFSDINIVEIETDYEEDEEN